MGSASSTQDQNGSCSNCDLQFTKSTRKTKRICLECRLCMCANCLKNIVPGNGSSSGRFTRSSKRVTTGYCVSCTVMLAADPTDQQLPQLKVKHLKAFLIRRNVPEVNGCVEKRDLVDLILANVDSEPYRDYVRLEAGRLEELLARQQDFTFEQTRAAVNVQGMDAGSQPMDTGNQPTTDSGEPQTTNALVLVPTVAAQLQRDPHTQSEANQRVHPEEERNTPTVQQSPRVNETHTDANSELSIPSQTGTQVKQSSDTLSKISLSEIESIGEVDNLSVKQLKIILTRNLVTYRGCKEKHELISKVKMLWQSRQDNEKLYQQLLNPQVSEDGVPVNREEPELCKICMDSAIDCVLLDCGHMVTCTQCGKQMNECPICRQFVIRAVHIFRA